MANTYAEKLKDPRWQKKRLEILQRDNFTCCYCGSTDKELHVHHIQYRRGADPWDYLNALLQTLCKDCHHNEYLFRDNLNHDLVLILAQEGFDFCEVGALCDMALNDKELLKEFLKSYLKQYEK